GIRRGLEGFRPLPMRMELRTIRGVNVINDAYNANPASMEAALKALSSRKGRKFALLGDMAELGSETERLHRELGEFCAHLPLEGLFLLGEQARTVAEGARKRGMEERKIVVARDHGEIAHALAQRVREGDWLLVKGSRIMATERVIEIWEEISGGEGA
ncbi:MAG: UDP-N-acetylmuramoyl-tripeptide--D-alanyl-D-alanine ligase, partial [Deltaproteobacteria bacterium]